jgi:hypothetical protein
LYKFHHSKANVNKLTHGGICLHYLEAASKMFMAPTNVLSANGRSLLLWFRFLEFNNYSFYSLLPYHSFGPYEKQYFLGGNGHTATSVDDIFSDFFFMWDDFRNASIQLCQRNPSNHVQIAKDMQSLTDWYAGLLDSRSRSGISAEGPIGSRDDEIRPHSSGHRTQEWYTHWITIYTRAIITSLWQRQGAEIRGYMRRRKVMSDFPRWDVADCRNAFEALEKGNHRSKCSLLPAIESMKTIYRNLFPAYPSDNLEPHEKQVKDWFLSKIGSVSRLEFARTSAE